MGKCVVRAVAWNITVAAMQTILLKLPGSLPAMLGKEGLRRRLNGSAWVHAALEHCAGYNHRC